MREEQILQLYREADAFVNVTGSQEIREEHMLCRRRIYVESDPFRMQVRVSQGDPNITSLLAAHDMHFTFGENIGAPDCDVPVERFHWLPTRQPVLLDLWANGAGLGDRYTTITNWHDDKENVKY